MGDLAEPASLAHQLWRALPTAPRRKVASRVSSALAPRPDAVAPASTGGLAVAGELARSSGLGEGARLMLAALHRAGIAHAALDIGEPTRFARGNCAVPPSGQPLVLHIPGPSLPLAALKLPRGVIKGRRVIGYWAWELQRMPASWRVGLEFVHEIWTPSRFAAAALAEIASHLPIRVVPHPLAVCPPVASLRGRADFGLPPDALITLVSFSLASGLVRKNPLAAIAAHHAAFGRRMDRILVLKIGHAQHYPADLRLIRAAVQGLPNVIIETRNFSSADRHALTSCADIVMSLHRSEGFGLVPAEAMLLGVPVVATAWSATTEFMHPNVAALVSCRLIPAVDPRGVFEAPGAMWAEPDIEDAAQHLRRLAADRGLRLQRGRVGRAFATALLGDGGLRAALAGLV